MMSGEDESVSLPDVQAEVNPYEARLPADISKDSNTSGDSRIKWPSTIRTVLFAALLASTVSIAIFVSLSSPFGNALEFF